MVSLSFAAAITERVRLGTSVIPLTITDPLTLAKQAATIDLFSHGRFELGVGAGWLAEEGIAVGRPVDHRSDRLEELLEIVRLAWTKETFSFDGRYFKFDAVGVNPRPPRGAGLPVWVGGQGRRAVEIAARKQCGLMLWTVEPQAVQGYRDQLTVLGAQVPLAAAVSLKATDGRWLETVSAYRDAGVDLLILTRYAGRRLTESLERFAEDVLVRL
jgi:alkanesulfonate monooxygenase SsuD/methylene tetrahydromethanopterin reductase-like flavin-dependent oxidoreductase (luciferase family)